MADVFLKQRDAYLQAFLGAVLCIALLGCERAPEGSQSAAPEKPELNPAAPANTRPGPSVAPTDTEPAKQAVTLEAISNAESIDELGGLRQSLVADLLTKLEAFAAPSQPVEFRPHIEEFANRVHYLKTAASKIDPQRAEPTLDPSMKPRIEGVAQALSSWPELNEEINRALSAYGILDCESLPALLEKWVGQ